MKPFHSREQILEIAAKAAPTKAVRRIIRTLGATVYGGRNSITDFPGWLVVVVGKHKKHYVEISINESCKYTFSTCHRDRPDGYDKLITREIL